MKINTEAMPQYKQDVLAAATLDFIKRILNNPEQRAMLEKKKAELNL